MMVKNKAKSFSILDVMRFALLAAWVAAGIMLCAIIIPAGTMFIETQVFLQKYLIGYTCSTPVIIILFTAMRKISKRKELCD